MPLNRWLTSIADSGLSLLGRRRTPENNLERITELCKDLASIRGEALGTALAREVGRAYEALADDDRVAFFHWLQEEMSPQPDDILLAAQSYAAEQNRDTLMHLMNTVESPRQNLFRRINMAPGGTSVLVHMRQRLLQATREAPELAAIDVDMLHLMTSWFNRGFLELRHINWETSADVLEKVMSYESVHKMSGWQDLKRRLAEDRRCFAFFHPAMPGEPLIFVEVALVNGMSAAIQPILEDPVAIDNGAADHAIFYSINNCQAGLVGISFGNFLIKQVVMELQQELPELKNFATLSPLPGFRRWLTGEISNSADWLQSNSAFDSLLQLEDGELPNWSDDRLQDALKRACARYLYHEKRGNQPRGPVERFHLGNGARIERINYMGDLSENGISTAWGLLVNYRYELNKVEQNHEAFVNDGDIQCSPEFRKLL